MTKDEVMAIEEIMNDNGHDEFSFEALEAIFLKDQREKQREYDELVKAFEAIKAEEKIAKE